MFKNIVQITHQLILDHVKVGDCVLDATIGRGYDTAFLAQLVGPSGQVYGFDIQPQALQATQERLKALNLGENVHLFQASNAKLDKILGPQISFDCVIFNLGYLPKGDKTLTTHAESSCQAIQQCLHRLKPNALLLIASYIGHPGGQEEYQAIQHFLSQIDQKQFSCGQFEFINQKNQPPKLFIIERRPSHVL